MGLLDLVCIFPAKSTGMRLRVNFILLYTLLTLGLQAQRAGNAVAEVEVPFMPSVHARMAAEWEPATGVLISWPPSIPHKLIIELAKDVKLNLLVEDHPAKQDAIKWLSKWGIMPDRVRFISAPHGRDVSWTRDWGPHAIFPPEREMALVDGNYSLSTPISGLSCTDSLRFIYSDDQGNMDFAADDHMPGYIAPALGLERVALPFSFTGGNILVDGQRTGFSTCIILNENRFKGIAEEKFLSDAEKMLGLKKYHILSNFEEEGIQHIDCYMKLLDEERILVTRPPMYHPLQEQYEGIITQELSKLTNAWGRPYEILRIDTDRYQKDKLAAYTNALILNQTVYVPLFSIPQDSIAIEQWKAAMPGYTIKGFEFVLAREPHLSAQVYDLYKIIGWTDGDALHCRTRAVWNPDMIFMSVNRLQSGIKKAKEYPLQVILRDYSGGFLLTDQVKVMYRVKGKPDWKETKLVPSQIPDHYTASIPGGQAGVTLEYYVTAQNNQGTMVTRPVHAPTGWYEFKIN